MSSLVNLLNKTRQYERHNWVQQHNPTKIRREERRWIMNFAGNPKVLYEKRLFWRLRGVFMWHAGTDMARGRFPHQLVSLFLEKRMEHDIMLSP